MNDKEKNYCNQKFLSPPVTPEQHVESCFMISSMSVEEHYNTLTLPASPPPCSMASTCGAVLQETSLVSLYRNRRKQRSPRRSLPSTSKGAFSIPLHVIIKALDVKTTHNTTTLVTATSAEVKGRKKRKECITPITQVSLEQVEQQEKQETHINGSRPSDLPLSTSLVLPLILHQQPSITQEAELQQEQQMGFILKSSTGAASIYDSLSANCDQTALFLDSEEWIPNLDAFKRKPTIRVYWKGSPLKIKAMPYFDKLHPGEVTIAATLRLTPEQYLKCKWALVLAAKEAHETGALFRKSEAQKVCCIDVNKTSILWNTFGRLGWLGPNWPQ